MKKCDTCGDCKFWKAQPANLSVGDCHLNAPVAVPFPNGNQMGVMSIRPSTQREDIACQQFRIALA